MSAVKIVPHPNLYPGCSVWGKTAGPVAYVGDCVPGNDRMGGVSVFLNEQESREVCIAWGWPLPEKYAELLDKHEDALAEIGNLKGQLEEAADALEASKTLLFGRLVPPIKERN